MSGALSVRFDYGQTRNGRRFETWAVMRGDQHLPPVTIDYDLKWWRREGSIADLKAMALAKAEGRV